MTDDTELDDILHELKSPTTDNYQLVAEAKLAIEAWSQRREAAAEKRGRIDELERINKLAQSAHSEGRGIKEIEDRIAKLTSDRTGGGEGQSDE